MPATTAAERVQSSDTAEEEAGSRWGTALPPELLLTVASHMDGLDAGACRQVCHQWNHVLDGALGQLVAQCLPPAPHQDTLLPKLPALTRVSLLPACIAATTPQVAAPAATLNGSDVNHRTANTRPSRRPVSSAPGPALVDTLPTMIRVIATHQPRLTQLEVGFKCAGAAQSTLLALPCLPHLTDLAMVVIPPAPEEEQADRDARVAAVHEPTVQWGAVLHGQLGAPDNLLAPGATPAPLPYIPEAATHAVNSTLDLSSLSSLGQLSRLCVLNASVDCATLVSCPALDTLEAASRMLRGRAKPLTAPGLRLVNLGALARLHGLRHLNLDRALASWLLPDSITLLTRLASLDVSRNCLSQLPDGLGALTQLSRLDLTWCCLSALPESFTALTALQHLSAQRNHGLTFPPDTTRLTALTHLDLAHCEGNNFCALLSTWHESFQDLRTLSLKANALSQLPSSFSRLAGLTRLDLSHNTFTALPALVLELQCLQDLSLDWCGIQELPNDVCSALRQHGSLRALSMNYNQLRVKPPGLGDLEARLEYLGVKGNPYMLASAWDPVRNSSPAQTDVSSLLMGAFRAVFRT